MANASSPLLLRLPPEIRNRIWELVVFHEPTNGVICPLQDAHGTIRSGHGVPCSPYLYHNSMTCTSGSRFQISQFQLELPSLFRPNSAQFREGPAAGVTIEQLQERWRSSQIVTSNHFCTVDCLVQPAICRVNRQSRRESLSFFYHVNIFHLELSNFAFGSNRGPDIKKQRTPVNWWRAIGDSNLMSIACLQIVGRGSYDTADKGLMVRYDCHEGQAELIETCGSIQEVFNSPCKYFRELCDRHERIKEQLRGMLDALDRNSPSVESMEKIARLMEPKVFPAPSKV